ncbi:hypothetical protein TBLA_0D04450 [Henningerozyma blattae CBS 6284]|uniref:Protoporphyrinogen oxidase n=1 Tax=Henningerozyma blattae (strain ATCC 34711 / CBS 6284 / DSM 70876 / NBRC 10599 / NRRL Y-10934 / UCD 77-7) TaxID=1071380 RepID=I2H3I9_HENB6|nr:hypothetical protein TBLA_0D04450 [Tetrapisispora blattae CBS 6284]CCH60941.1 hypothetical protein TBLA_0D04450 [Tetrapisispora blattae CBS 6284]
MLKSVSKLPSNANVAVIGGGFTGLTFTYFLNKLRPDVKITIFEGQNRTGGWIESKRLQLNDNDNNVIRFEKGPRTLRGVSDGTVLMVDMLEEIGKDTEAQLYHISKNAKANKQFLLDTNNRLIQVPNSLKTLLKFSFNPLGKGLYKSLIGEWKRNGPANPQMDESVASLLTRRFGSDQISKNIMSALYRGIYAGDVKALSAQRTCNRMFLNDRKYGSFTKAIWNNIFHKKSKKEIDPSNSPLLNPRLSIYQKAFHRDKTKIHELANTLKNYPLLGFKNGIETFPKLVRQYLEKSSNVNIHCGNPVSSVIKNKKDMNKLIVELQDGKLYDTFDHVRFTINPEAIGQIMNKQDVSLSKELSKVNSSTTVVVSYYLPNKNVIKKEYEGFGFLVPSSTDKSNLGKVLGVVFDSCVEHSFKPLALNKFFDDNKTTQTEIREKAKEYTKLTIMLGGYMLKNKDDPLFDRSKAIDIAKKTLHNVMDISEKDLDQGLWDYSVATNSLPQYFVGYDDWQKDVEKKFKDNFDNQVSLGGMGFARTPSLSDLVLNNCQASIDLS